MKKYLVILMVLIPIISFAMEKTVDQVPPKVQIPLVAYMFKWYQDFTTWALKPSPNSVLNDGESYFFDSVTPEENASGVYRTASQRYHNSRSSRATRTAPAVIPQRNKKDGNVPKYFSLRDEVALASYDDGRAISFADDLDNNHSWKNYVSDHFPSRRKKMVHPPPPIFSYINITEEYHKEMSPRADSDLSGDIKFLAQEMV